MTNHGTDARWLHIDSHESIGELLKDCGVIDAGDGVADVSRAGDGNMNLTLRVATSSGRSVIVKQSRPWVEKYPEIAAPVERIEAETLFYQSVADCGAVAGQMPTLLATVPERNAIVLEDFGAAADCAAAYRDEAGVDSLRHAAPVVGEWLAELHRLEIPDGERPRYRNAELRALNHAHIFEIPFGDAMPFSLDTVTDGLEAVAKLVRDNDAVRRRVGELGELYLADGPCLLHGDFFPGSWLVVNGDVKVIDPEFSFCGRPEFDLAVTLAHFQLAKQSKSLATAFRDAYARRGDAIDWDLVEQWSAIEVLRRLLGVAQLPVSLDLAAKQELVSHAVDRLQ